MKKNLSIITLIISLCLTWASPAFAAMNVDKYTADIFDKEQTVVMGNYAVFCLKNDNSLWAWGINATGEIGNGKGFISTYDYAKAKYNDPIVNTPYKILDNVREFNALQTWAITNDNALWVWGDTAVALGLTDNALTSTPQKYMDNVRSFSYGVNSQKQGEAFYTLTEADKEYNFFVVKTDGNLFVWGDNVNGELGVGNTNKITTPTILMNGVRYVSYVEGRRFIPMYGHGHIFAVKEDNSLWDWGADANKMHTVTGGTYIMTPQKSLDNVKYISSCKDTTFALTNDSQLYVLGAVSGYTDTIPDWAKEIRWIGGSSGGVGNDGTNSDKDYGISCVSMKFHKIADNVREVHNPSTYDIYYITNNNELLKWNLNSSDKIADNVLSMSGRYYLKTNGELFQFNTNNDSRSILNNPLKVLDNVVGFINLYSGNTFAIKNDGSLYGRGYDSYSELMGKGNSQNAFIYLTDGVKFPYDSEPIPVPEKTVGNFQDVKVSAWYAEPVQWAVDKGITAGTSDTTFSPDKNCSNMEILTFMYRGAGSPTVSDKYKVDGLKITDYCYNAAAWAYENGMIDKAWKDRNEPCTRSQAVYYMWQFANKPDYSNRTDNLYTDIKEDSEYKEAVMWATDKNITSGIGENKFAPNDICNRAQIVTFLNRMFK